MKAQKRILRWQGGKARQTKRLLSLIPKHECYCELFGGEASLLFDKPRSKVEVYNDIDGELVMLFRVVKYHYCGLVRELEYAINARADFRMAGQEAETDIRRSANFLLRNQLSFGGGNASFGVSRTAGGAGGCVSLQRMIDALPRLHARLERVIVENKDWRDCLRVYDGPGTFFYLDPPYVGGKQAAYESWSQAESEDLAGVLRRVRGKWLLTLRDTGLSRKLFGFARVQGFERQRGINNKEGQRANYRELIIRNY